MMPAALRDTFAAHGMVTAITGSAEVEAALSSRFFPANKRGHVSP
jgi:hypothetical protein